MTLNIPKFSTADSVVLIITNTGKMFLSQNYAFVKQCFYFMYVLCRFSAWNLLFFVWPNSFCTWLSCIFGLALSSECIEWAKLNLVYIIVLKQLVIILQSDPEGWENLYFKILSLVSFELRNRKSWGHKFYWRRRLLQLLTFPVKRKLLSSITSADAIQKLSS